MESNKIAKTKVFELEDKRALILYPDFLVVNLKKEESPKVVMAIEENYAIVDDLEDKIFTVTDLAALKFSNILNIYTDIKHDDDLVIVFKDIKGNRILQKKLAFKDIEEKDRCIAEIFNYIKEDFTYEKHHNNLWGSIRIPFKYFLQALGFGGLLTALAYYMNTAESYSFRVPIIFYPVVLIMEIIGYKPVAVLTGALSVTMVGWIIKNMIIPTERLIIQRKNIQKI